MVKIQFVIVLTSVKSKAWAKSFPGVSSRNRCNTGFCRPLSKLRCAENRFNREASKLQFPFLLIPISHKLFEKCLAARWNDQSSSCIWLSFRVIPNFETFSCSWALIKSPCPSLMPSSSSPISCKVCP